MGGHPQSQPSTNSNVSSILTAFLLTVLVLHPAAAQTSLFFTPEETQAIETLAQAKKQTHQNATATDITLDAILYYSPDDWKIWLQGEPWTPETRHPGLRVLKVSPDRVILSPDSANSKSSARITLKPRQRWNFGTNRAIDGDETEEDLLIKD